MRLRLDETDLGRKVLLPTLLLSMAATAAIAATLCTLRAGAGRQAGVEEVERPSMTQMRRTMSTLTAPAAQPGHRRARGGRGQTMGPWPAPPWMCGAVADSLRPQC